MTLKNSLREWLYPSHIRRKELLEAIFQRGNGSRQAGVVVNPTTVATHGDVFTCIRILSTAIGQLPVELYREKDGVKDKVEGTYLHSVVAVQPCFYMNMQEWLEMCISCLALRGNFYAEIVRNKYGNIAQLIPFAYQDSVRPYMQTDGAINYQYTTNDSRTGEFIKKNYSPDQILHIKMNTFDGLNGTSPITHAARELGISIATEEHTASIFENDATPKFILESDQTFGEDLEAFNRMRDSWNEAHKGSKNSGKPALLEYGFKAKPMQLSPVDTQLIEQRMLSREKVYAMFGVPFHRGDMRGSKYGNVENGNLGFYRDTLAPLITRIENHLNGLLPRGYSIRIDDSKFTRGDSATLTEVTGKQVSMGLITINEGREAIGLQPVEGGDVFATTTNNLQFSTWADYDPTATEETNSTESTPNDE
ncbi:Phage portal protein, HK97 family [Vibrio chagasii]|nr:Phage portal protein, HK97 family [Vibrio chagasii]